MGDIEYPFEQVVLLIDDALHFSLVIPGFWFTSDVHQLITD